MIAYRPNQIRRINKALLQSLALLILPFFSAGLSAQTIPQLQSPTSISGATTTAEFSAGARVGSGAFTNSFEHDATIELQMEVTPEAGHVGNAGNVYALIIVGGQAYTLNTSNNWVDFDGTVGGLGGALMLPALSSANNVSVTNIAELFDRPGVAIENGSVSYALYLAYDTVAAPNELYFSASPLIFTVTNNDLAREITLPELSSPSALIGDSTTARFYGGAQVQGSGTFPSILNSSDSIAVDVEFDPELGHQGTAGNAYVIAVVGNVLFILDQSGTWLSYDGSFEGLVTAASYSALQNFHGLSIDNVINLNSQPGVQANAGNVSFAIYVAYDTSSAPGNLYFSGVPLQFSLMVPTGDSSALEIFESSIADPIIQARCINCHVAGGPARDTGLVFQRTGPASTLNNYQVFEDFVATRSDARDHILTTASGGNNHTGGVQLAVGGTDYNNMANFLDALISGGGGSTSNPIDLFFQAVTMQSAEETLRRATIIFAGRAPTASELVAVSNGNDATLRNSIRDLMEGDAFHEFLLDGANDRLLVRGTPDGSFLDGGGVFPNYRNTRVDLQLEAEANGQSWNFELAEFNNATDRGLRDSPLELIASIVENERPYSEILTADYMMLNPMANFSVDGTANFNDEDDQAEFQPGEMDRYYAWSETTEEEEVPEIGDWRILDPGNVFFDFPHAGVLNTQAFLFRYPTTATNRNRARARWTFFHFLDIDIERSAQRTTDPVALADTNNPTMFNENCTVCHATMDPVAGAFQLYGDEGHFRTAYNGTDSLDDFYKYPEDGSDSLYQEGDLWYRDMRAPGLFDQVAPNSGSAVQWLAQQIVQEPAFARASVKFWWPAVIGSDALRLPEVEEDATYAAQLLAYDAQAASIQDIADDFIGSGMNVKDMLVELVMSPWFRADSINGSGLSSTQLTAHEITSLGNETLLTPERLARKTRALTGYGWNSGYRFDVASVESGLDNEYGLYYGGIDSFAVTNRSREMTPLMSTVSTTHALESSCPIVLKDFLFEDGNRRLFNGISPLVTPISEGVSEATIETNEEPQYEEFSTSINFSAGSKTATVSLQNGFCDWDEEAEMCTASTFLGIQSVEIRAPGATSGTVFNALQDHTPSSCSWDNGTGALIMGGTCQIEIPFSATVSGEHTVIATLAGIRTGEDIPSAASVDIAVGVNTTDDAANSKANGATEIREKLVDLHTTLLGETYGINSAEIQLAYDLYLESWQERMDSGEQGFLIWDNRENCNFWNDAFYFEDLPLDGEGTFIQYGDNGYPYFSPTEEALDFITLGAGDPAHTKGTWVSILTYLLSHYHYLYE